MAPKSKLSVSTRKSLPTPVRKSSPPTPKPPTPPTPVRKSSPTLRKLPARKPPQPQSPKTPHPQSPKTPQPQSHKTPQPQSPKTPPPQSPKPPPPQSPKPPRSKKKVSFSNNVTVKLYTNNNSDTSGNIINVQTQKLLRDCHVTQNRIADLINQNSVHRILKTTPIDPLLKVNDLSSHWWADNSPMILFARLQNDKPFQTRFIKMFDSYVRKNQNVGEIRPVMINNSRFKIYFDRVIRTN